MAISVVSAHLCPFGLSAIKPVRRWMMNCVCDLASGLEVIGQCHLPSFFTTQTHKHTHTHTSQHCINGCFLLCPSEKIKQNNMFSSEMDISLIYQSIDLSAENAGAID